MIDKDSATRLARRSLRRNLILILTASLTTLYLIYPNSSKTAFADSDFSVEQLIVLARKHSTSFQAIDLQIQSLEAEIRSRDLILSGRISAELSGVNKEEYDSNRLNDQQSGKYALFDSVYIKPFDTGTELALGISHNIGDSNQRNYDENEADWELRLSQSLWRDSMGRGTNLRRQAEANEFKSRYLSALSEQQQLIKEIEDSFWDLVLAHKEVSIQKINLDRSRQLLRWIKDRVDKFAAEEVDLLQVETLLSERELDLSIANDFYENSVSRLKQLIPNIDPSSWSINLKALEDKRAPLLLASRSSFAGTITNPILTQTAALEYRAVQLQIESERIEDSLSPDLSAFVSYGANGNNDGFYDSWVSGVEGDSNQARIGLLFSMELDSDLKNERIKAAKYSAESEKYRVESSKQESRESWHELLRNINSLEKQVSEARRLNKLQQSKVLAERQRFEQGRSTTFQMVSFELDANISELRLYRLLRNLRKSENQARSYLIADI